MIFASADQIARAIVAAAQLTGANPRAVPIPSRRFSHDAIPRARCLAYVALREALPDTSASACARGVGMAGANPRAKITKAKRAHWWRDDMVEEIVGAILIEDEPAAAPAVEAPAPQPAPTPDDAALRRHWRPSPPPKRVKTPGLSLGKPPAGRSALDRRGRPQPDDEAEVGARKKITLPRVKFLEKGF